VKKENRKTTTKPQTKKRRINKIAKKEFNRGEERSLIRESELYRATKGL